MIFLNSIKAKFEAEEQKSTERKAKIAELIQINSSRPYSRFLNEEISKLQEEEQEWEDYKEHIYCVTVGTITLILALFFFYFLYKVNYASLIPVVIFACCFPLVEDFML